MTIGRHAETRGHGLKRKVIGVPLIAWLIVVALAGTAMALFVIHKGMQGSVTGGIYALNLEAADSQSPGCSASAAGQNINLAWTGAVEGDQCHIRGTYQGVNNTETLKLQSFEAPAGLTVAGFDETTCGTEFVNGSTPKAQVILTFDGTQSSITFDPVAHGFRFVRASEYNAANCNLTVAP